MTVDLKQIIYEAFHLLRFIAKQILLFVSVMSSVKQTSKVQPHVCVNTDNKQGAAQINISDMGYCGGSTTVHKLRVM